MRELFATCSRNLLWTKVQTLKMSLNWEQISQILRISSLSESGVRRRKSTKLSFKKCFLSIRCTTNLKAVTFSSRALNPPKNCSRKITSQNVWFRQRTFSKKMDYSVKVIKLHSTKTNRAPPSRRHTPILVKLKISVQEKTQAISTKFFRILI